MSKNDGKERTTGMKNNHDSYIHVFVVCFNHLIHFTCRIPRTILVYVLHYWDVLLSYAFVVYKICNAPSPVKGGVLIIMSVKMIVQAIEHNVVIKPSIMNKNKENILHRTV